VTLKAQGSDPDVYGAKYLENGWRKRLGYDGASKGNSTWGIN